MAKSSEEESEAERMSLSVSTSSAVPSGGPSSALTTSSKPVVSSPLSSLSGPSSWKAEYLQFLSHVRLEHLLAGMTGGVASTLVLHPLDLVKIRFAVNDGGLDARPKYNGLYHAFRSILKDEGLRGLYR